MLLTLFALAAPLCLDSFLIAAAIGLTGPSLRERVRISLIFAVFEAGMPLVGLIIGNSLSGSLGHNASYLAILVLVALGVYILVRKPDEDQAASHLSKTHGLAVIAIGLSISLDGLAIGFTYGLLHVPVLLITVMIAAQAIILTQLGFLVSKSLPERVRQNGERLAGLALVAIGIFLLIKQLLG